MTVLPDEVSLAQIRYPIWQDDDEVLWYFNCSWGCKRTRIDFWWEKFIGALLDVGPSLGLSSLTVLPVTWLHPEARLQKLCHELGSRGSLMPSLRPQLAGQLALSQLANAIVTTPCIIIATAATDAWMSGSFEGVALPLLGPSCQQLLVSSKSLTLASSSLGAL